MEKRKKSHEADWLRNEYLRTDCPIKKNWAIKKLIAIWEPYVKSKIERFDSMTKDEIMQIYRVRVLESITAFKAKNRATFKSFLYYAAMGALSRYQNYENKVRFETNCLDIDTCSPETLQVLISSQLYPDGTYTTTSFSSNTCYYSESDFEDTFIQMGIEV